MNESREVIEWLTSSSPTTFIVGVLILVFGTQKILSAKNVEDSLGGLALPFKWIRQRRDRRANEEAEAEIELREMYVDQHRYIVELTKWIHELEVWAASKGEELPPPQFLPFTQWREEHGSRAARLIEKSKNENSNKDEK